MQWHYYLLRFSILSQQRRKGGLLYCPRLSLLQQLFIRIAPRDAWEGAGERERETRSREQVGEEGDLFIFGRCVRPLSSLPTLCTANIITLAGMKASF